MRTNIPGGVRVVALPDTGARLPLGPLAHGEHPEGLLRRSGFRSERPVAVGLTADGALELAYRVTRADGIRPRDDEDLAPWRDADLAPDEVGEPHQRVGAYAVVTSDRGVLLTQFNAQTRSAGEWGLPGGGLEPGEGPVEGVLREVWEETGQQIELGALVTVQSRHWVGRAPHGAVEDFHAVGIVYLATCPRPVDVIIHDAGGTTSDARWVPFGQLHAVPLTRSWRRLEALSRLAQPPT